MLKRYAPTTRFGSRRDQDLSVLIEQQVQMFARIAERLESMDARLERLVIALEDARNISSHPF